MNTVLIIIGAVAVWTAGALAVGVIIGKSIAEADRTAPTGKLPHLTLVRDAG